MSAIDGLLGTLQNSDDLKRIWQTCDGDDALATPNVLHCPRGVATLGIYWARMKSNETRLNTARLRVAEQEKLVAVWRETISGLTKEGQPTDLAEKMLQLMERTLARFRADLAKLTN